MEESIFCQELQKADEGATSFGKNENQLVWTKESVKLLNEFVRTHSTRKLYGKCRKLKKKNRLLRRENEQLRAENEELRKEKKHYEEECNQPTGEDKEGRLSQNDRCQTTVADEGDKSDAKGNATKSVRERRSFVSKVGDAILKTLPKLLYITVKTIVSAIVDRVPGWIKNWIGGDRNGGQRHIKWEPFASS